MCLTVSRIALVKPDKARGVEDVLLRAAQTGGISEKVIVNCSCWCFKIPKEQTSNCYIFLVIGV
jgi:hypothetical protein